MTKWKLKAHSEEFEAHYAGFQKTRNKETVECSGNLVERHYF